MDASSKYIKNLNGQLVFVISWSSRSAFRHVCWSPCKGCFMEKRLPPFTSDPSRSSDRFHKAYDQKAASWNVDRKVSTPATQPTEMEKRRQAPYKLKTSTWNSIPKSSPRSLGLFPAATIAQALTARCKSQSPLWTAPTGSWLWRYKVFGLEGLGVFCLKYISD